LGGTLSYNGEICAIRKAPLRSDSYRT
jgi:hypothetical protein